MRFDTGRIADKFVVSKYNRTQTEADSIAIENNAVPPAKSAFIWFGYNKGRMPTYNISDKSRGRFPQEVYVYDIKEEDL